MTGATGSAATARIMATFQAFSAMRARIDVKRVPRASRSLAVLSRLKVWKRERASGVSGTVSGSTAVSGPGVMPARLPAAAIGDQAQCVEKLRRRGADAGGLVLLRIVVLRLEDDEAGERAIDDVGRLQGVPEVDRRRRAVDAEAGLIDVAPFVLAVAVCIHSTDEDCAAHGL